MDRNLEGLSFPLRENPVCMAIPRTSPQKKLVFLRCQILEDFTGCIVAEINNFLKATAFPFREAAVP